MDHQPSIAPRRRPVLGLFGFIVAAASIAGGARGAAAQPAPSPVPIVSATPMMTPVPMATAVPMTSPLPGATASASPPQTPSPGTSPAAYPTALNPPENSLVTQRVRDEFVAWQRGRIDRKTYSPYAGGTDIDALVAIVAPLLQIGPPQSLRYRTTSLLLGDLVYRYDVIGANGSVSVLYALDQNGKTDGITFTPEVFRSASISP